MAFFESGDPEVGMLLTKGNYIFSRVNLDLQTDNPWLIEPPSLEVENSLHGFDWLNDLSACGNDKSQRLARDWMLLWYEIYGNGNYVSWGPEMTALRTINLFKNWRFVQKSLKLNIKLYHKILKKTQFYLSKIQKRMPSGLAKARVLFALFILSLMYQDAKWRTVRILSQFQANIQRSIKKDYGVQSRNPEELVEFFALMSEVLIQAKNLNWNESTYFYSIISYRNNIAPIIRGLRIGNGSLIRVHGGNVGNLEVIDKYLSFSGVKGPPLRSHNMGFERVTAGRLTLIADCSKPPKNLESFKAHASCLSFELSSGQRPIFVNCGPGGAFGSAYKRYCRSTFAHNSCTLGNLSQLEYTVFSRLGRWQKEIPDILPSVVKIERNKTLEATWLNLSHNSFETLYGFTHFRKLLLLNSGKIFTGTDSFKLTKKLRNSLDKPQYFASYFHLHPDVELWDHPRLHTIILRLKNGEHWIFDTDFGEVRIEDSTYIGSAVASPINTKRIVVLSSELHSEAEIKWSLRRREIFSRNTRDNDLVN